MGPLALPIRRPSEHLLQQLARPPCTRFAVVEVEERDTGDSCSSTRPRPADRDLPRYGAAMVGVTGWAYDYGLVAGGVPVWYWALPAFLLAGAVAGVAAGLLRRRSRQLRSLALRESAVWEAVGEGLVRLDAGALIAAWSPGATALYGHTEADALGRPLAELFVDADQARELLAKVEAGERPAGVAGDYLHACARGGRATSIHDRACAATARL